MNMNEELTCLLHDCDTLKERLSGLRPLPSDALQKIEEAYNIEYTYESNRIEGIRSHSINGTCSERRCHHCRKINA